MSRKILLSLVVFGSSLNLWCQVEPSATGGGGNADDDSLMTLPPAVSGSFYPSEVGDQYKENTLTGGILFTAAYDDNVLAGQQTKPITAESYSILPNIAVNTRTSRLTGSLRYSPGFVFYHPTTELNDVTQNAVADFSYRITPHTILGLQESFQQNSTVFSGPYTSAGATISASPTSTLPIVLIPYGGEITDFTNGHIGYQISRSSMIGASGYFSSFHFSGSALSEGLYDSSGGGGGASYSRRLTRTQFMGLTYGYSVSTTSAYNTTTDNHTGSIFYSIDLGRAFSLSLSGGPEYSTTTTQGTATTQGTPPTHTWAPSVNASIGWQKQRAEFALSYAHSITTGYGLLGSFTSDSASAIVGWQFTRRLIGDINGSYSNTKSAASQLFAFTATGHTVFGRATLSYKLNERLNLVGEYSRLHQAYSAIGFISSDPDADRVALSLNYEFTRPLGR